MAEKSDYLKRAHATSEYTPELIQELAKCKKDPVYFMRNYIFVQHPKRGKVPFDLYDYQVEIVNCIHNNRHSIVLASRQVGKTITIAIYLLWFAMFSNDKTVLVASNKFSNALEIMQRVQFAYEELPHWLKPGVIEFNKTSMEFDNGSRFFSQATTGDTGRGKALSKMFIDELAFVRKSIQDELWASIAPTLATGGDMIISSTPNGDNELFASLWRGAKLGKGDANGFSYVEVAWDRHPERDEKFRQDMIAKIGELKWKQEFENEFISSDPLLINSIKLQQIKASPPTMEDRGFKFWGEVDPRNSYYVGADISVGVSGDYSTIQVLEFPTMRQFAEFRSNTISPQQLYARIKWILTYLKTPKSAPNAKTPEVYWSFENNGVGASIVALYQNEDKFPDAILLSDNDRVGMVTSAKSKLLACLELKRLIEKTTGGIQINSQLLIDELKNYISNGKTTYHAKQGATDDLIAAMLIVMNVLKKATDYEEAVFDLMYSSEDEEFDESDPFGADPAPMVF